MVIKIGGDKCKEKIKVYKAFGVFSKGSIYNLP